MENPPAIKKLVPIHDQSEQRSFLLLAIALAAISYVNILGGDFVYDDQYQIVDNYQIKHSKFYFQALTSDVWSFKGGEGQAMSNYWRPGFVAWLMLNYRLFGVQSTFGWHLTNLLLHIACVALVYLTLLKLGVRTKIAAAMTCIFAVHPVHVESVAWISGAADMLMAIGLLSSLLFVLPAGNSRWPENWMLATGCYLFALFSKEAAMLFPFVVFAAAALQRPRPFSRDALTYAAKKTLPFVLMLILYLGLRLAVLGFIHHPRPETGISLSDMVLTWPTVALFYVRQVVFPWWMGPSYPIRAVESVSLSGFVIPAILFLAVGGLMLWAAWRHKVAAIGLALFIFTLAPAMNVRVFTPEQLVHDRYLYLPLMGALMVIFAALVFLLRKSAWGNRAQVEDDLFKIAIIVSILLMIQTMRYNRAWATDVALWQWGVRSDPGSMFNFTQYGVYLEQAGRTEEALTALNKAIELSPLPAAYQPNAYLQRGEIFIDQERFAEAEADLNLVLQKYPNDFRALERLAVLYERQGKLSDAENVLRMARDKISFRKAELTERIAIVLYLQGKQEAAVQELLKYQDVARTEPTPRAKLVLYRLGLIYLERRQLADARRLFQEFQDLTAGAVDPITLRARKEVANQLDRLR